MCIIIYKPQGIALDRETLERCARKNPDGFGIVYPSNKALKVCKTMNAAEWVAWGTDPRITDRPALLHARIATSGVINCKTYHPFKVASSQPRVKAKQRDTRTTYYTSRPVMMHNGILRNFEPWSKLAIESDSIIFAEEYLEPLARLTSLHSDTAAQLIEPVIDGSRIAIMTISGEVSRYGRGWRESEGVWYSNDGYKPAPEPKAYYYGYNLYDPWEEGDAWKWYTERPKTKDGRREPLEVIS